ncbi:MAG: flagellar biosynthesis protein FlhF [Polyangiaceae bacterium]
MQYQSFRGADVREALSAVRASLGPDALIESTRHVSNGRGGALGNTWVEVTAAIPAERTHTPFARDAYSTVKVPPGFGGTRTVPAQRARTRTDVGEARRPAFFARDPEEIERELTHLREMLEDLNAARPPRERALALLSNAGVEGPLARQLATGAGRVARRGPDALLGFLADRVRQTLPMGRDPLELPGQQVIVCVGNTGVGKTTTLAKVAARARLDLGRTVSVLSLDSYRVGAVEQWQRFASLMGVPFHALRTGADLARRIGEVRSEIVLVDTTGKSHASPSDDWHVPAALDALGTRSTHVLLVMPAWVRGRDAERVAASYRDARMTGLVVTKLDETCQLGGVLHAAIPNHLPLTYMCDGPRVPEDIHPASSDAVLSTLFAE